MFPWERSVLSGERVEGPMGMWTKLYWAGRFALHYLPFQLNFGLVEHLSRASLSNEVGHLQLLLGQTVELKSWANCMQPEQSCQVKLSWKVRLS